MADCDDDNDRSTVRISELADIVHVVHRTIPYRIPSFSAPGYIDVRIHRQLCGSHHK